MRALAGLSFAVIIAFSPTSALSQSAGDAQALDLLAKHKAFVGWQFGDGTFQTMRITGNVADEKGKQTETFVFLSDGLLYNDGFTELKRNGIVERDGFTGNLFWQSNYNGFTTPVYGNSAKFLASATILRNEGTTELPATYRGPKTIDDKQTGIVRVTLKNGDPIDLYVDPSTGAYVQAATVDPDGTYETTYHIRSYQDVLPGKKMASSYTVDDGKSVTTFTKFEPNVPVTAQDIHPPAALASWTFGDGTPFPFTMTHDRMLVDATINGVKGRFLLDTGADAIVLDDRFADRAHAEVLNSSDQAYMISGEVKTRLRKVQTVTLGNSTLHDVVAFSQAVSPSEYGNDPRDQFDGFIGFDLFAGAVVKLNVYDGTMAILDPNTDLSSEKGLPITVDLSQGTPIVPMILDNSTPVNAMLDTGSPGLIFFGPDLVSKYHFKVFAGCTNINTLSIGPIVYAGESACQYGLSADYMLIGFDFLRHFDFVFDYPHARMFMRPNKN
ncbi:MAG TPA: retropepsin-like aspartic protease [Candidatus Cybelea sp.]|nr:retropepsin-like aspartic protease [Candidatus Cybelea sp.]